MKFEEHRWFSPSLQQQMDVVSYGHDGKPILVFPPQGGVARDFANFGMVEACRSFIDGGRIRLFSVDSVDNQSWANFGAHPADRARRHEDYDRYIMNEVRPFIAAQCGGSGIKCFTTGCSMGGYHAANFFFRHPDFFDGMISLSGLFQLSIFIGDYVDDNVYFNTPLYYLPGLGDRWYLDAYAQSKIVVCSGQGAWEEQMIADARALKEILQRKGIPHWIDLWGADVCHDWPWWQRQLPYFLERCL